MSENIVGNTQKANETTQQHKVYDSILCECGEYYSLGNRANHRRTKKHKAYENIQIISPQNERITCPCGGRYTWNNKSRHCSTLLHKNYLSKLEEKSESDKDGYDSESDAHSVTSIDSFEKRFFSGYYRFLMYTGDDCD